MSNLYILANYCVGKTAMDLAKFLSEKSGRKIHYVRPGHTKYNYLIKHPPLIRWGNSSNIFNNDTKFNSPEHINITSNKVRLAKLLSENGLPCITFNKGTPTEYPVVIRKYISGQGGKGIIVIKNEEEFKPYKGFWWSKFIPFRYEIRLHSLGGNPIKILKKVLLDGQVEDEFPIRNNDNKYHYRIRKIDNPRYEKAILLAKEIYKIFPINMVGWDMGYYRGNFYIIEGNSAPSLNSINLEIYGNYLYKNIFG